MVAEQWDFGSASLTQSHGNLWLVRGDIVRALGLGSSRELDFGGLSSIVAAILSSDPCRSCGATILAQWQVPVRGLDHENHHPTPHRLHDCDDLPPFNEDLTEFRSPDSVLLLRCE